jgi:hypothetical protein
MHETSTLPKDFAVPEQHDSQDHQTVDTLPGPISDGRPRDVAEIMAALEPDAAPAEAPEGAPADTPEGSDEGAQSTEAVLASPTEAVVSEAAVCTSESLAEAPAEAVSAEAQTVEPPRAGAPPGEAIPAPVGVAPRAPAWPFVSYALVWLVAASVGGWLLVSTTPSRGPIVGTETYRIVVLAGAGLTALGPVLALIVWIAVLVRTRGVRHRGVLTSSLLKGALATLCGVALWWAMLLIVDTLRLGRAL